MIDKAVKDDIPLAISPSFEKGEDNAVAIEHESTPFVYKYCGFGKVQILGTTPENTKLILVEGEGKALITNVSSAHSFNEVDLACVTQETELSESSTFIYRRIRDLTREKLSERLKNESEVTSLMGHIKDPQSLVSFYSDHILEDFEHRLEVFASNNLEEKIALLGRYRIFH